MELMQEVMKLAFMNLFETLDRKSLPRIPGLIKEYGTAPGRLWVVYVHNCKRLFSPAESYSSHRAEYAQYKAKQGSHVPRGPMQVDLTRKRPGAEFGLTSEQVRHMLWHSDRYAGHPAMPELLAWQAAKRQRG